jgi:AraC family transcriptional regulator of adaptative response / methylphosphotriester-DNA alkyltransferase methyltransferase
MEQTERKVLNRNKEITDNYFQFLDKHIADVVSGNVDEFMEINKIARELFLSHKHLTDIVQKKLEIILVIFMTLKFLMKPKECFSKQINLLQK